MQIGLVTLISIQKVIKTCNKQGSKYHFLSTNQVGSVSLIENLLDSRLETRLEVVLQLTYVSCPIEL